MKRWYQEHNEIPNIRMIVVYTGDVKAAEAQFHIECMTLRMEQVIELAERMEDEQEQKLVLSGLLVISDKFISKENAEAGRRRISMTKIGRMLFEDGMKEEKRNVAGKLLEKGISIEIIMDATELTKAEVEEIKKGMLLTTR